MIYVINILFNNAVYISFQQDEKKVYSTLCYRISMSSSKKKKKTNPSYNFKHATNNVTVKLK